MNKKDKYIIITGAAGGIGLSLVKSFKKEKFKIIGIDNNNQYDTNYIDYYFNLDIEKFSDDEDILNNFFFKIEKILKNSDLICLINNAAIQIIKPIEQITMNDFSKSLKINTLAPFFLIQKFLPLLEKSSGSVINISSIHSILTKQNFVAYATSKSALSGLTKALSIELGHRIRINAIAPAAINTKMLREGFIQNQNGLKELSDFHPVRRIGEPEEVAKLALFLSSNDAKFINGSIFYLDGGISNCLHDPN